MQLPTNRGGFADASSTFNVRLGDNLTAEKINVLNNCLASVIFAVPEPSTWAIMTLGFAAIGFALRRRRVRVACFKTDTICSTENR
ncbi:PEPxxWA-CTERM sorting domain-containing protein [Sphingobium phenoxybenzoativorans]|uniref:PEPxxWA-CTERM sorting domain-containing protein n=1 Tax=Sphingobium phenoxybenzoativorans TaxID=1592790 RepID=UPI0025B76BC2|nr:PEPxxWA-CTERM sorting domain-containing protein [Sphingobium phenoxybenzoativorans]